MSSAAPVQDADMVWLKTKEYDILPLNPKLALHVPALRTALTKGVTAYPDSNRPDFYDVELESGWSYVHVHDDAQTVYLVAFSRN